MVIFCFQDVTFIIILFVPFLDYMFIGECAIWFVFLVCYVMLFMENAYKILSKEQHTISFCWFQQSYRPLIFSACLFLDIGLPDAAYVKGHKWLKSLTVIDFHVIFMLLLDQYVYWWQLGSFFALTAFSAAFCIANREITCSGRTVASHIVT